MITFDVNVLLQAFMPKAAHHERCRALVEQTAVSISPGRRHWRIFEELVDSTGIRGSDTTDAYLAALAIEHGCEWWTADQ